LPIDIKSYGIGYYKIMGDKHTKAEHKKAVAKTLDAAKEKIYSCKYDLVILDEVNVAIGFGLLDVEAVLDIIKNIPQKKRPEIILTGRRAHVKLKKIADLVTEMKPIKHYFDKGTQARKGIEF
jgi:cob(I)alamin adenosyltransferase